jgi:hypothetical protein
VFLEVAAIIAVGFLPAPREVGVSSEGDQAISCSDASAAYASSTVQFYRNADDAVDRKTGPFLDNVVWIWAQYRNVVLYRRALAACPAGLFDGCAIFTETKEAEIERKLDGAIPPSEIPVLTCRVRRLGFGAPRMSRPPEPPVPVTSEERPAL